MARFGLAVLLMAALSACLPPLPPQNAQPGSQGQRPVTPAPKEFTPPKSAPPDHLPENSSGPFAQTDQLVIPGQRVGPITAHTSRADLTALYGEAALADGLIAMGENTLDPSSPAHYGSDTDAVRNIGPDY